MSRALTDREALIARHAQTMPNAAIAAELGISIKTVEGTLARVFRKLGIRSRAELTLESPGPQLQPNGPLSTGPSARRLEPDPRTTRRGEKWG